MGGDGGAMGMERRPKRLRILLPVPAAHFASRHRDPRPHGVIAGTGDDVAGAGDDVMTVSQTGAGIW